MEGGDNKGFHGYRRVAPGSSSAAAGMKLPADINPNDDVNNNNNDNIESTVREQDMYMPIANVIRIMRRILPPHAKISDEAKETIQECVSEYISFITGEANERCQREQRKTITAEDVLWAMSKLGFDDYIEPLTFYLNRYRDLEGDRGSIRGKPLVNRVVGHDASNMGPPFNGPVYGPMPMGGFHYGGGNGFYPSMVGYVKETPNSGSSSQAGVGNNGVYGHGPGHGHGPAGHGPGHGHGPAGHGPGNKL